MTDYPIDDQPVEVWLKLLGSGVASSTKYCNGDAARGMAQFVKQFARPEGRMVGSEGHGRAVEFINRVLQKCDGSHAKMVPFRDNSFLLPYSKGGMRFTNIVGRLPSSGMQNAFLIGAHYDTCGETAGADDNAAAIAIIFNVLMKLESSPGNRGRDIIIAFFDAEEPPHYLSPTMGSIRFYEDQLNELIGFAIILDLVGHDVAIRGFENLLAVSGIESHPQVDRLIKTVGREVQLRIIPTLNRYIGDLSDYHIFRLNNVPYLFFSCGRWEHYHAISDTPEKLNYGKMEAIAQYLTKIIVEADRYDFPVPAEQHDTTKTELEFICESLGGFLAENQIPIPKTRSDIDNFVSMLLSLGL